MQVARYVHFGVNLSCFVAHLDHTVPFNGHIGGSPDPVSNLGSQDKALKRTPAPAPEPVSFIQASALDQAMLTPKS